MNTLYFIKVNEESSEQLQSLIENWKGKVTHAISAKKYHKGFYCSDYTRSHTTLLALKVNKNMTYIQAKVKNYPYNLLNLEKVDTKV